MVNKDFNCPCATAWKVSKYGVISVCIFLYSVQIQGNADQKQLRIWKLSRVNLWIQSECRKIQTKNNSVFEHFSRTAYDTFPKFKTILSNHLHSTSATMVCINITTFYFPGHVSLTYSNQHHQPDIKY